MAGKLNGQSFIIIRQAGDSGQLYGSVATRDIAAAVTEGGFSIERRQVMLDRPIKMLGLHEVRIALHAEVEPRITVNVARSHGRGGAPGARRDRDGQGHGRGRGGGGGGGSGAAGGEQLFEEGVEAPVPEEGAEEAPKAKEPRRASG